MSAVVIKLDEKDSAILVAAWHLQRAKLLVDATAEATTQGAAPEKFKTRLRFIRAEISAATDLLQTALGTQL